MTDSLMKWLRKQVEADRRTVEADDRHWSEVPDALFSRDHAAAEVALKASILNMVDRWTHPTPELQIVRDELLHHMAGLYAERKGFREEWTP